MTIDRFVVDDGGGGADDDDGAPGAEAKGWLNPTQTLVEQGLLDDSVVTLKKKFYVDDDRVDRSDPVQLHLVYVQCHECTPFVLFSLIGAKTRQAAHRS